MDEKLYKATREGNTSKLQELLEEDPILLDKVLPLFTETPLHVAAMVGSVEFVELLLSRAPWLAKQPSNRDGINSLHIVAAKDHVGVASVLLDLDPDLVFVGDNEGCCPLHYAAYYGSIEVARLLVMKNPLVLKQVNSRGETSLHVGLKSQQYEVLVVLLGLLSDLGADYFEEVTRSICDKDGQSFWQLALCSRNSQVVELVKSYGSTGSNNQGNKQDQDTSNELNCGDETKNSDKKYLFNSKVVESSNRARETFLIAGSLIATVTFQALITPPQSIWKANLKLFDIHEDSVNVSWLCLLFLVSNSSAFVASCWGLLGGWRNGSRLFLWVTSSLGWAIVSYFVVLVSMVRKKHHFCGSYFVVSDLITIVVFPPTV